jgi:hypothetical protein
VMQNGAVITDPIGESLLLFGDVHGFCVI